MIGIGVVVSLYVLTRLIPARWRIAKTTLTAVSAVVTAVILVDLVMQGFGVTPLSERFRSTPAAPASELQKVTPQAAPAVRSTVTRTNGGSVRTVLGYGYVLNKASGLEREWIAIHDPRVPADVQGTPGIATHYKFEKYSGDYSYRATATLKTSAAITAYELRFLLFDVWGSHTKSLSATAIEDVPAGATKPLTFEWRILSENEAEEHYASIAYVARIRLADGRVVEADPTAVLEEARKFSSKFAPEDLEPRPVPPSAK